MFFKKRISWGCLNTCTPKNPPLKHKRLFNSQITCNNENTGSTTHFSNTNYIQLDSENKRNTTARQIISETEYAVELQPTFSVSNSGSNERPHLGCEYEKTLSNMGRNELGSKIFCHSGNIAVQTVDDSTARGRDLLPGRQDGYLKTSSYYIHKQD